ncbi:hypothetical protein [Streptomyces sp. NBC_01304]|uniref:hypothetical protein n=1 Tax=Streptomyces sp. NBC_01304 TaxID=2903818 RepID=UPI002E1371C5|nr:hypothetical protein OG430_44965 [Streptomyces sp. NBC_01304]
MTTRLDVLRRMQEKDSRVSLPAFGMMLLLLELPPNVRWTPGPLSSYTSSSEDDITAALDELAAADLIKAVAQCPTCGSGYEGYVRDRLDDDAEKFPEESA